MNFEGVLETLKRNKEYPTVEEESLAKHECPKCMWPMKEREDGALSCPCCGEVY